MERSWRAESKTRVENQTPKEDVSLAMVELLLGHRSKLISGREGRLTHLEGGLHFEGREGEGEGQNWLAVNLLYFHELSMSQDIMYPLLFDPSPGKACRDVENSNSRGRVENRGRKTHQVQGNRPHQAQVATFPMEPAEGARQQERREIESRFSKGLSTA